MRIYDKEIKQILSDAIAIRKEGFDSSLSTDTIRKLLGMIEDEKTRHEFIAEVEKYFDFKWFDN